MTSRNGRRLAFVLAAAGAGQAAQYLARPMTSYRLLALGAGPRQVGYVAAAFAVVPVFLAIPLGRFADRRRSEALLVAGSVLLALACVGLAFGTTVWSLTAASVVLGLGHLALMLGVQNAIALESHAEQHDPRFGLFTAVVSLGQLVGPLLGGAIVSSGALRTSTTHALLAAAGLGAVGVACAFAAGRPAGVVEPLEVSRGTVRRLLGTPGVPAGIFASVAVLSCVDVFTAYLPVLGQKEGIAPGAVGALLALRAAASIVSRLGITTIVRHVGRTRLIALSAVISAVAIVGIGATGDFVAIAVLTAVAGFTLGFGQPLTMTMVVQLVPAQARATALGLRLTGNRIGQAATPAAAGAIAGSSGVSAVFWLLGGILAASAIVVTTARGS
ncbi:MAG: MFS transporter [Gaiellaceae bacterium]